MADNTPRLDLERFDQGDASWDHTDTVEAVDENAIVHGPIADRPTTGTYDDELYHATDQNITWRWDNTSSDWVHFSGLGSESQRVPGTSHLTDIDVNTLADTALSGQIDTTQLSDDAVTAAKIAAAAVQSEQIATDAVGSAEIATDAVSVDELAAALGTTSSNRVPGTTHFEESSHEALEAEQPSQTQDPDRDETISVWPFMDASDNLIQNEFTLFDDRDWTETTTLGSVANASASIVLVAGRDDGDGFFDVVMYSRDISSVDVLGTVERSSPPGRTYSSGTNSTSIQLQFDDDFSAPIGVKFYEMGATR